MVTFFQYIFCREFPLGYKHQTEAFNVVRTVIE